MALAAYPWQPKASRPEPPALKTYRQLLEEVDTTDRGDLYSALMGKEKDTLEVVNRIAGLKAAEGRDGERSTAAFYRKPIHELASDLVRFADATMRSLVQTLAKGQSIAPLLKELVTDNTSIFNLGVLAILIAVLVFVLSS